MPQDVPPGKSTSKQAAIPNDILQACAGIINDVLFATDAKGLITYIGPQIQSYGFEPEEVIGHNFQEFVLEEDQERIREVIFRSLETGKEFITEFRIRDSSGAIRWVEENGTIVVDSGSVTGVHGILRDITKQKEALLSARHSERRLADIINFLPDATFAIDKNGQVIAWNRAIEEMTGIPAEAILGKGEYEYSLPFYRVRRKMLIDLVFSGDYTDHSRIYTWIKKEGEAILAEMDMTAADGRRLSLWGKATPFYDEEGNITGAVESIRNITEISETRKALESLSRELEQRVDERTRELAIINEIIRVVNSSLDLREMVQYVLSIMLDAMAFDMGWVFLRRPSGKGAELIASRGVPDVFIASNQHINMSDYPYNIVFYAGQSRFVENMPEKSPGAADRRILENLDAIAYAGVPLTAESVVVGAIYIGRRDCGSFNSHERLILESIGKEIGGTIYRGILQEQLEEAYEAANRYLNILVHDIRTENSSVAYYAGALQEIVDDTAVALVKSQQSAIQEIDELIENVSVLRSLAAEKEDLGQVDLDRVVCAELEKYPGKSIEYEPSGISVLADEFLFEVFANLIGNSIKFGGPDVKICIRAEEIEGFAHISVEDNGPGVADSYKERIFTCFAHNTSRQSSRGIGLHIVRTLIERYGGTIRAEDRISGKPEGGVAIHFTLVLSDDD